MLTEEEFKRALPDKVKKSVNKELMSQVNGVLADPEMYEAYRENLLSYTRVMQDGRFKVSQYIDAIKYVSYKLTGSTNIDAYTKTFPDRIARFAAQGVSNKDISSYVTAYNKSKLVNLIFEQTLVPSWVLNADMYQKALNTQAELMMTAKSEKVRSDAANSILTHLKQPEAQKIEMEIGLKQDSSIDALRASTMEYVKRQREAMELGVSSAKGVAEERLVIEHTPEEDP